MTRKLRVLVIGAGYAGKRFIKAISHFQHINQGFLELVGVVDIDKKKLSDVAGWLKTDTSLENALDAWTPDVAVICVNEYKHYEVLDLLCRSSLKAILCEKPLTRTLEEAADIQAKLQGRFISLNLVERFSPIVEVCRKWLSDHPDVTIRRAEFFWGKHRVRDPRPSIGVCSEAIHPIDLIRLLFGCEGTEVHAAIGVVSDMQAGIDPVMDSVSLLLGDEGTPVIGQSSFAWPERDRRVVAFAGDGKNIYRIRLQFDNPYWDCDQLVIVKIDPDTGEKEKIFEYENSNKDFPADLSQIYKVFLFVRESLKAFSGEETIVPLVGIDEAIELQTLLENISNKSKVRTAKLTG